MALTILVVDDNKVIRDVLVRFLGSRPGWTICGEAADGVEAVERAIDLKPDVIVMDVTMPKLNGLEATRLIREKVPESEVVIVSQHRSKVLALGAIKAGARAYVEKSEIAIALFQAVETAGRHDTMPLDLKV